MGIELIDRMNEVVVWQGIKNPEIYLKIAQALDAGEDAAEVAKAYGYRPRTVKEIGLRMSRLKLHRLALSDDEQRIEIGTIASGGGSSLPRSLPIAIFTGCSSRLSCLPG